MTMKKARRVFRRWLNDPKNAHLASVTGELGKRETMPLRFWVRCYNLLPYLGVDETHYRGKLARISTRSAF